MAINLGNLKHAWNVLKEESVLNCLQMYETKEFTLLVNSITNLEILIKRLENPEKTAKLDKLMK